MEKLKFLYDPRCPWCWQTSRWAARLQELGEVEVDWGLFSLEIINAGETADLETLPSTSAPAMRTIIAIRSLGKPELVGEFIAALGERIWSSAPDDDPRRTKFNVLPEIYGALNDIGLDQKVCDQAIADPKTWDAVVEEHNDLVHRTDAYEEHNLGHRNRAFGVPSIILDGGNGPAIFGPVLSAQLTDEDAIEMWHHVSWLARHPHFSELKRGRISHLEILEHLRQSYASSS